MGQENKLRRLTEELYRDNQGTLYVYMKGFLARHGMADSPESRAAVLEEIRKEFGEIRVMVLEQKPSSGLPELP